MQEVNLDKYYSWIKEGKSFSEIRKDLLIRGFSDEQTTNIIATLNDWLLQTEINKSKISSGKQWKLVGWILIMITLSLTLYSFWISSFTSIIIGIGGAFLGWTFIFIGNKLTQGPSVFQPRFKQRRRNF